jgi:AraC-like DNA-binding protein
MLEAASGARAVERVFRSEGVPFDLVQNRDMKLPLRSSMAVIERAAREAGDPWFGINLGDAIRPEDFGPSVRYMLGAPDARALLWRARRAVSYFQSGTEITIEVFAGLVRWGYRVTEPISFGRRHHADHVIRPMLTGLRRYLGQAWRPLRIEMECDRPERWRELEVKFQAPVIFGAHTNAVVFHSHLLDRAALDPLPLKQIVTVRDLRQVVSDRPPKTSAEAARELIKFRLADSVVDIEGAAKLLGMGTRKLQRQLAQENLTYRELVEQVRMERALDLMRESVHSVTSIALLLGYSEIASFTRAFQRWTGRAPSHYRASDRA